jgi:hypothetical protein
MEICSAAANEWRKEWLLPLIGVPAVGFQVAFPHRLLFY